MESVKERVPLASVRPDEKNPREDFGDIDALARTIAATGGDPVNPIVCVRDGNAYRIVDGERRYRAVSKLRGKDPDATIEAIVFDTLDAARALTAMLATDDKRPLSDAERGRGVQDMLILGVDDEVIAGAARVDVEQVRRCRRVARSVPAGSQVTIDQMAAASEFEDEEERERVLDAGPFRWRDAVAEIRREHKLADAMRRVEDACDDAGVPIMAPRALEEGGYHRARKGLNGTKGVRELAAAGAAVCPDPDARWPLDDCYSFAYQVWLPEGVEDPRGGSGADSLNALEREVEESRRACGSCARSMAAAIARVIADPDPRRHSALRKLAVAARDEVDPESPGAALLCGSSREEVPVGLWEEIAAACAVLGRVDSLKSMYIFGNDGNWSGYGCRRLLSAAELARACGWQPTGEEEALLADAAAHDGREQG